MTDRNSALVSWIVAHPVFAGAACVFGSVFYAPHATFTPDLQYLHWFKFAGVALTFWASLHGALDFTLRQAREAPPWLRGANLTLLGSSTLLCLLAMAWHARPLAYSLAVQAVLSLYLLWDVIAIWYYRRHSPFWHAEYVQLCAHDIRLFTIYAFTAYIPFWLPLVWPQQVVEIKLTQLGAEAFGAGLTAAVLWYEFAGYWIFSIFQWRRTKAPPPEGMAVEDGYAQWANTYERGNAVIGVERRHTAGRLAELHISGTVLDLGSGTGHYVQELMGMATTVLAHIIHEICRSAHSKGLEVLVECG